MARELIKFLRTHNKSRTHTGTRGIGLAAPQLGIDARVCVLLLDKKIPLVLINPEIVQHSQVEVEDEEGCLSLPGQKYKIKRWPWCVVQADSLTEKRTFGCVIPDTFWNPALLLESRCVQHEIDHLSGILICDKGVKCGR